MARQLSLRAVRPAPAEAPVKVKLALTERLLATNDLAECAQHCLEWLRKHAGVTRALCLVIDSTASRLVGVAGHGMTNADELSIDLEDHENPLVAALTKPGPVLFWVNGRPGSRPRPTPLGTVPCVAVPLHGGQRERPVSAEGLLLAAPPSPRTTHAARWVARVLGARVVRHRTFGVLADTERRLQREQALLNSIIDAVTDPILLTDSEGRIVVSNTRAEALLASTEGESEGRRHAVALNNMFFSAALSQRAIEAEAPSRELILVDPTDGSDRVFELLSATVSDPREGTGIVSILRNVTDLRSATEALEDNYRKLRVVEADVRAERDRLDLIIDSAADPIVVTDSGGSIVHMNPPADRLFSAAPDGSPDVAQRIQVNDVNLSSFVSNVFLTGTGLRYEGSISLVDPQTGVPIPVEAISGKILSEHGEVTAVVTTLHDLTGVKEKERLYEQLKRASEQLEEKVREATAELVRQNELLRRQALELEQASALKSQFVANMSHEFRTPLNAILGYTKMLLHGVAGELPPPQRRSLTRVDSNARHLLAIINNILDLSRIEAGRMPLRLTEFALPDLVNEVVAEVEPIIAGSKVTVRTTLESDLPRMLSDRPKVKQIVLNLLTNAIKFTPEGVVTVSATYDRGPEEITIAVADTGIGIAESDQQKIFEDFLQVDNSSTREYGGAGLGLSISRRLASMLGGHLAVDSVLGVGSTFRLILRRRARRR